MNLYTLNWQIILLQEHWQWNFKAHTLADIFPDYNSTIKCADDQEHLPNDIRLRERAGVAVLWNKSLSHHATVRPDGSERISVVSFKCSPMPICVMNVYMPPQGTQEFKYNFDSHLDQLFEISPKFTDHILILGGDLNAFITISKY